MSEIVTIQGTDYTLNNQGDNPPFGEQQSELIRALVDVANASASGTDILPTSFTLTNNTAVAANVTGLSFDTSQVRSAFINYSIYISTSLNEYSEAGQLFVTYKSTAATWELARFAVGDAFVTFTITNSGQVQYVSSNVSGTSYSGKLKFSARTFTQT